MTDILYKLLLKEEALKLVPYRDHLGYWTIGIGHMIDRRKGGSLPSWITPSFPITEREAEELCRYDIGLKVGEFANVVDGWIHYPEHARVILTAMAFQMGVRGVLQFGGLMSAVRDGRWAQAAAEMRDSLWWRTQTPARAERLAKAMEQQSYKPLEV